MPSLQELLAQKQTLERQIHEAQHSQRADAIAQIRQLMADNALTTADLAAPAPARKGPKPGSGRPVAAKYRHPETGDSWTGRGLKPKWLVAELEKGKSITDFSV